MFKYKLIIIRNNTPGNVSLNLEKWFRPPIQSCS